MDGKDQRSSIWVRRRQPYETGGSKADGTTGPLYYIYLVMLPTFTTNSINILAGVNGVEVIQGLIIGLSVMLNDLLFLPVWPEWFLDYLGVGIPEEGKLLEWAAGEVVQRHLMSFYFMAPLVGVCAGFIWHNWYVNTTSPCRLSLFLALGRGRYLMTAGTQLERSQATHSVTLPEWHSRQ